MTKEEIQASIKQPESLCCFCTNQIFNFFSCNTAVFQCILKNE